MTLVRSQGGTPVRRIGGKTLTTDMIYASPTNALDIKDMNWSHQSAHTRRKNLMASCEQLAGELKVLEELLKHYSTEHKRQEIIDRIDQIKTEQQERGCLEKGKSQ